MLTLACLALFAERPNLLLITADDLGVQLGCYGDPQAITPRLDAFADSAVRFEVAWVAQASCSPSRSAMLTGLYPHTNGQVGLSHIPRKTPDSERFGLHDWVRDQTLVKLLHDDGYRTGLIGKLHVNPESEFPFDVRHKEGFGTRLVGLQARQMRDFVADSGGQPWFLMANLFDPHVKADKSGPGGAKTWFPDQVEGIPETPRTADQMQPLPWQGVDDRRMLGRIAGLYNCIERVDHGIGLMLDELERSGQAESTVVIILGDHGPPTGRGKGTCYEAGLRVPFLVRWPGVSQPHASPRLVSAVDIAPTFLDAAGVSLPQTVADSLQGRSLRPVLSPASDADWRTHLFAEFQFHGPDIYFPRRTVRTDRYKLIHNPLAASSKPMQSIDRCPAAMLAARRPEGDPVREVMARMQQPPEWELHDLKSDPWEWENLSGRADLAEIEKTLKSELDAWRERTGDPFRDPKYVATLPTQRPTQRPAKGNAATRGSAKKPSKKEAPKKAKPPKETASSQSNR